MTSLVRERLLHVTLALLVGAGALWLVLNTEWVDVLKPTPPRGEARRDGFYAAKQVLTRLGVRVQSPDNLDRLPPVGATLVLSSFQWNFMPERNAALRNWVEAGNHLVLPNFERVGDDIAWIPVRERKPAAKKAAGATPAPAPQASDEDDEDEERPASAPRGGRRRPFAPNFVGPRYTPDEICTAYAELGSARRFRLCEVWMRPRDPMPWSRALWSLHDDKGAALLRVPVGQGRVTVIAGQNLLNNRTIFHGDHAQAMVAAMDIAPGSEVWFVVDEKRATLLAWLWQHAGPALMLAALALALVLWRGAVRFGPLLPVAPLARRSLAEQVRGTTAFVRRMGGAPLARAARRALDDAAQRRVPAYDRLTLAERARHIASATGLAADALASALNANLTPNARELPQQISLLETARRRLLLNIRDPKG